MFPQWIVEIFRQREPDALPPRVPEPPLITKADITHKVHVRVGDVEIRPIAALAGPGQAWRAEVLLDGVLIDKVRTIDLHIEAGELPTLTLERVIL